MTRGRSRSASRSRSKTPFRRRQSPSEFRSMTRSRSRSRSPSLSPSRDRGRPLRSKYARSSSSSSRNSSPRSKKSQSVGRRPPSHQAIPTIDLTSRSHIQGMAASWLDPTVGSKATPPPPHDLNNPPPGYRNPLASAQVQASPMNANPIPSVSQTQMRFPPSQNFDNNFQGDFPSYGSSFYSENSSYTGGQQNNYSAPAGPSYTDQQISGGGWNDYPSSMSGNGSSQPAYTHAPPSGVGGPSAAVVPPATDLAAAKNAAVEQELAQQKKKLAVEREDYFRKRVALTKELKVIRERVAYLNQEGRGDPKLMKESTELQEELMLKLKSIDNVIDMLTHIIGDRDQIADILKDFASALELPKKMETKAENPEKRRRSKSRSRSRSRSPSRKKASKKKSATPEAKVNIVHYDPELHWCSTCNVFPRSAIEYLTHLHSDVHKVAVSGKKSREKPDEEFKPWRVHEPREPSPPSYKHARSKRVPIRGVPFLIPATAWYCSLCRTWLGDLELAERHLKGPKHASTYTEFVSQNPHWEVDWLRDRTRAYEKNSEARAKVEEISKKLAGKGKPESKPQDVDIGKLTEMLASARKKALGAKENRSRSSSSSSSSEESGDDEEKGKKAKKKKGKGKKKKGDDSDKDVKKRKKTRRSRDRSDGKKDSHDKKDDDKKDRGRGSDKRDKTDDREDRHDRDRGYQGNYRGSFRGRRPFRGRGDWGRRDYNRSHDEKRSHNERRSRSKDDVSSSDRERKNDDKDKRETPAKKSPYRSFEHDWERVLPGPVPKDKAGTVTPRATIGKRPGLGGGISREKFGFQRKNVFERLDKDKPDDLYGPLEPPKKE